MLCTNCPYKRWTSPVKTWFPYASTTEWLMLAHNTNSLAHSSIGTASPAIKTGFARLFVYGFRIYFTPLTGGLFTFPSRYLFTIGVFVFLAFADGPAIFTRDYTCPMLLRNNLRDRFILNTGLLPSMALLSSRLPLCLYFFTLLGLKAHKVVQNPFVLQGQTFWRRS